MKRPAKNPHLKTLELALAERFGWQAGPLRDALVAVVASKADRLGLDEISYCRMAASSSGELQAVAEEVAPGDTRFFREPAQYDALRERVIPEIVAARSASRRLRMWSIGSSTGEEPYSLAMLVRDALPPSEEWRVEIFASDLRGSAIMAASRARYHAADLRMIDPTLRNRYFIGFDEPGANRELELIPLVRRTVAFRRSNVCEPHMWRQLPGPYDLVVCENLLASFHRLACEQTVARLAEALGPGAVLMVGPHEVSLVAHAALKPVEYLPPGFLRRTGNPGGPGGN